MIEHAPLRLLHLLDPASCGESGVVACREAMSIPGVEHRLWLIGGSNDAAKLRLQGLSPTAHVTCTLGHSQTAWRGVRRLLDFAPRALAPWKPSAVLSYSVGSLGLSRLAFGSRSGIARIGLMSRAPTQAFAGPLERRLFAHAVDYAPIITVGSALASAWSAAGVAPVAVLSPPVHSAVVTADARAAVRRALDIRPDETVMILLADPVCRGDARRFAHLAGILRVAGQQVVGIAPRQIGQLARCATLLSRFGRAWDMITFDGAFLAALPAADLVVWDTPNPAIPEHDRHLGGAILAAAAAGSGIPVVATRESHTRELLGRFPVCLANGHFDHHLGMAIRPFITDAKFRTQTGEALRQSFAQSMPARRFREQLDRAVRSFVLAATRGEGWWASGVQPAFAN